jgi:hypothetical protein
MNGCGARSAQCDRSNFQLDDQGGQSRQAVQLATESALSPDGFRPGGGRRCRRTSSTGTQMELWSNCRLRLCIPPSARSLLRGNVGALRQARSSASAAPPFGLRYPSKSCSQSSAKRFLRASVNAELRPWEPAPCLASRCVTRGKSGNSTKRRHNHVPEQSQPHRIPRR